MAEASMPSVSAITKSAAAAGAPAAQCNMCQKKGLPILPVRYSAVGTHDMHGLEGVPVVSGSFGAHVKNIASRNAQYTLRSMRYGFIYIFYPKKSVWKCFAVTREGNCYEYPIEGGLDRSTEKPFSCTQTGHPELAQCITIESPDKAGTVYMAFSDVEWTKAVRDAYAHDSDGCRSKRMQAFNASAWHAKPGHAPHAASHKDVHQHVAEYKGGAEKAFFASPFPYKDRSGEKDALSTAMDHIAPDKGAVFALWDPIGITQELNIENHAAYGFIAADHEWGEWSASMVLNFKEAVEKGAVEDDQRAEDMAEGQVASAFAIRSLFDGGAQADKTINQMRASDAAGLGKVKEDAWEKYKESVSDTAAKEYLNKMHENYDKAQQHAWLPLSQDYTAWLGSPNLAHVFQYDYDESHYPSGMVYESIFTSCITGACARRESYDLMTAWLKGEVDDKRNLALRALTLNQKQNGDRLQAAGNYRYIELRETCAKAIEAWFQAAQVTMEKTYPSLFTNFYKSGAKLIYELGAPIAKVVADEVDSLAAKTLILSMSARSGKVILHQPTEGTPAQRIKYLARQMWELTPADKRPSKKEFNAAFYKQFTTKTPEGKVTTVPQYIVVDKENLQSTVATSAQNAAQKIINPANKVILTDEVVETKFIPSFRKVMEGEPSATSIGAVFAFVNIFLSYKDYQNSTHFNSTETLSKFIASGAAFVGSIAMTASKVLEKLEKNKALIPARLKPYVSAEWIKRSSFLGRMLAAPAAFIGAYYDYQNAKEQWEAGHIGLAVAYTISAGVGVVLGVLALANIATSWVLPLGLLLLAVGLIIYFLKERELLEFLGRSYFGKSKEKYQSLQEEQHAYNAL
ncbi:T6SS effector BTH_I2691 family protein [Paraburkholderia sp. EG287A]|uniref:T6SS effector BTH_I2691 family protein n=1 Tax=unclassified Paraburkholderia TaxID=2615204 RepID=UPI0034D33658